MAHMHGRPRSVRPRSSTAAPVAGFTATFSMAISAIIAVIASSVIPALAQAPPPVDGVVVDSFRPPAHIGAPGNRGWEYATTPGSEARAVLGGVVAFAGPVGGALHVTVDHAGGLRTSYSFLATVAVSAGEAVGPGHVVGTTGARLHFGLRRGSTYLDPAILFGPGPGGPARLVPRPGRVPSRPAVVQVSGGAGETTPLHSLGGSDRGHMTLSPRATHGRRVSGVGSRIR